jgi:hypothetical protein
MKISKIGYVQKGINLTLKKKMRKRITAADFKGATYQGYHLHCKTHKNKTR